MAYTRLNLTNGQVLTAEHMSHIEDALANTAADLTQIDSTLDFLTSEDIADLIAAAKPSDPEPEPGSGGD